MKAKLRRGGPADVKECGRILFEAFRDVAVRHNFRQDLPSVDAGVAAMTYLLNHPKFYATVAEVDGRIAGSNFLDERSQVAGLGPISVDPKTQGSGIGRALMQHVIGRAHAQKFPGVRLAQAGYNNQTLCLYTKLGFRTREPLSLMRGTLPKVKLAGSAVRSATAADIETCNRICRAVHGHDRAGEVEEAVRDKAATLVERLGRVTGYATGIGFFAHAVAETNDDLFALIGAAKEISGPGMLVPTRNHALFTWCLDHKLELVQQMTHMSIGLYNEPQGAYLPTVLY